MSWKEYLLEETNSSLNGFYKIPPSVFYKDTLANIGLDDVYYNPKEDKFYNDSAHNPKKVKLNSIKNKYALSELGKIKSKFKQDSSRNKETKISGSKID